MGKLDVENRTYTAESGLVIPLKKISYMLIGAAQTDQTGMPTPPILEVSIAGSKRVMENPDDPGYKDRLRDWNNAQNMRLMRLVFAQGTNIPADPQWVDEMQGFIPNPTPTNVRVYWLFTQLTDDESQELFEAIMSMTLPTEKGMTAANDRFQGND